MEAVWRVFGIWNWNNEPIMGRSVLPVPRQRRTGSAVSLRRGKKRRMDVLAFCFFG